MDWCFYVIRWFCEHTVLQFINHSPYTGKELHLFASSKKFNHNIIWIVEIPVFNILLYCRCCIPLVIVILLWNYGPETANVSNLLSCNYLRWIYQRLRDGIANDTIFIVSELHHPATMNHSQCLIAIAVDLSQSTLRVHRHDHWNQSAMFIVHRNRKCH